MGQQRGQSGQDEEQRRAAETSSRRLVDCSCGTIENGARKVFLHRKKETRTETRTERVEKAHRNAQKYAFKNEQKRAEKAARKTSTEKGEQKRRNTHRIKRRIGTEKSAHTWPAGAELGPAAKFRVARARSTLCGPLA